MRLFLTISWRFIKSLSADDLKYSDSDYRQSMRVLVFSRGFYALEGQYIFTADALYAVIPEGLT